MFHSLAFLRRLSRWLTNHGARLGIFMVGALVLAGGAVVLGEEQPHFEMEVVMEDTVLPYTPIPVEVVITNVSDQILYVGAHVEYARTQDFSLKIRNEEDVLVYEGVASPSIRSTETYYGSPRPDKGEGAIEIHFYSQYSRRYQRHRALATPLRGI